MANWPPFAQWVVQLFGMLSNLAVFAAAIAGIIGLWRWRAELVGRNRFEVARRIMILALRIR